MPKYAPSITFTRAQGSFVLHDLHLKHMRLHHLIACLPLLPVSMSSRMRLIAARVIRYVEGESHSERVLVRVDVSQSAEAGAPVRDIAALKVCVE